MILLTKPEEDKTNARIHKTHSPEIFAEARDFWRENESLRSEYMQVHDPETGELLYLLHWESNRGEMFSPMIHVSEFWNVDTDDEQLDFELIDRAEVFIFYQFDEYSYELTRIIRKYRPDRFIFFVDDRASFFFPESDCVHIIENVDHFYLYYPYFIRKSIMLVDSEREYRVDPQRAFNKQYSVLHLMTSLFWKTNRISFGEMHPDKTFYLIRNDINIEGLVDIVKFCLFRARMASERRGNLIPVIDQGGYGEKNQFTNKEGENVWTLFFEQITDIPLTEVYQSKNVILAQDRQLYFNPYVEEVEQYADWSELFREYLRFNQTTLDYAAGVRKETIPDQAGSILGIIGRGTDYNAEGIGEYLGYPAGGEELVEAAVKLVKEKGYDYVFLATEDAVVFRTFMESELKDKLLYVPQDRIDYQGQGFKTESLSKIYAEKERDGYQETLKYISILKILSECDALISSIDCGAWRFARALNQNRYDLSRIIPGKRPE